MVSSYPGSRGGTGCYSAQPGAAGGVDPRVLQETYGLNPEKGIFSVKVETCTSTTPSLLPESGGWTSRHVWRLTSARLVPSGACSAKLETAFGVGKQHSPEAIRKIEAWDDPRPAKTERGYPNRAASSRKGPAPNSSITQPFNSTALNVRAYWVGNWKPNLDTKPVTEEVARAACDLGKNLPENVA